MTIHHRPGPYRNAEHYLRGRPESRPFLLPPNRPGVRRSDELDATSRALASALWPRIRARYATVKRDHVLPTCWTLVAMGYTLDDLDDALWVMELLGRYGEQVSSLDIREAVRVLGSQADLYLETFTTGLHAAATGTGEFPVALWEYQACMTLTVDGAARVREHFGFPQPPRELVDRERREEEARPDSEVHESFRPESRNGSTNRCRRP